MRGVLSAGIWFAMFCLAVGIVVLLAPDSPENTDDRALAKNRVAENVRLSALLDPAPAVPLTLDARRSPWTDDEIRFVEMPPSWRVEIGGRLTESGYRDPRLVAHWYDDSEILDVPWPVHASDGWRTTAPDGTLRLHTLVELLRDLEDWAASLDPWTRAERVWQFSTMYDSMLDQPAARAVIALPLVALLGTRECSP